MPARFIVTASVRVPCVLDLVILATPAIVLLVHEEISGAMLPQAKRRLDVVLTCTGATVSLDTAHFIGIALSVFMSSMQKTKLPCGHASDSRGAYWPSAMHSHAH